MPNFTAFALVAYTDFTKDFFKVESKFISDVDVEHEVFSTLQDAQEWMKKVLKICNGLTHFPLLSQAG